MRYADCHPDQRHHAKGLCKPCWQKNTYNNSADRSAQRRSLLGNDYFREAAKKSKKKLRLEVLTHYGLQCSCSGCDESNYGFLTIDHINGGGGQQRRELGGTSALYLWIKRQGYPDEFRTLCYNCNLGRSANGGVCPHKIWPSVEETCVQPRRGQNKGKG
jgi:hypothetical protein